MTVTNAKTEVDWFKFRAQADPRDILESVRPMFGGLGSDLVLSKFGRGRDGWDQRCQVMVDDLVLARMDYGGDSQRGWTRFDMSGAGCRWVRDWGEVEGVAELPRAQLRRVDVALTTWQGEVSYAGCVAAYAAGRFDPPRGARPKDRRIESSDPYAGRTLEVGSRSSSPKFMRCYEKGWQMLAEGGVPEHLRGRVTVVEGFPPGDIFRCEVEFKPTDRHDLPWDIVHRPDEFFAGAFPFCQDVLPGVEVNLLARRPERHAQRSLEIALEHVRTQFGPTLFTALHAHGGDILAVWDLIVGRTHSEALLEAGVLVVEHGLEAVH